MTDTKAEFNWASNTWDVIDKPFEDPDFLLAHQIESFNNLMTDTIPRMFQHHCPIRMDKDGVAANKVNSCELNFLRIYVSKPVQHDNSGYNIMYPHTARMLNHTYSAPVYVDLEIVHRTHEGVEGHHIEEKVPVFKMPVMVGSKYCHLYGKTRDVRAALNECRYDRGGYFIINGSEKVIISQERPVDNRIMLFKGDDTRPHRAEVKSTIDQRFYPIKIASVYYTKIKDTKKNQTVHKLEVSIPHVRKAKGSNGIPLFIVFRALGIVKHQEIIEYILGDKDRADDALVNLLFPSVHESSTVATQYDAIKYISNWVNWESKNPNKLLTAEEQKKQDEQDKLQYTKDIINREFISHVGQDCIKKAHYLGCMVRKLLKAIINPELFSDRDHYANKRVNLPGPLLAQIIRYHMNRLIKDIKGVFVKELSSASGNATSLAREIRKVIQKCNIESKVKYALSTGNWHTSHANATSESKKGNAQVLQRLTHLGMLSQCRRVSSPLERAGSKHEPPRRYNSTQIGKICPNETPEGQQVGTVKNLALLCHVSIECTSMPIRYILSQLASFIDICEANPKAVSYSTNVFVNGDLVGVIEDPDNTYKVQQTLKAFKINGKISRYTSISWFIEQNELQIFTDGGRYCRPLYLIDEDNHFKMDYLIQDAVDEGVEAKQKISETPWETLLKGDAGEISERSGGYLEYIDTYEEEAGMLAIFPHQLVPGKIHRFADDQNIVTIQMGYDESQFNLEGIDSKKTNMVHQHIKDNLPERYHDYWDQVKVQEVNDIKNVIITLDMGTGNDDVRTVVKHLNRLVYTEYLVFTHCEIHPAMWHSVVSQMIPFPDHNQSPRNCYQASMGKQAIGIYATNYGIRTDTMGNIMTYPQRPLVQPRTAKYTNLDELPAGFQSIVAIASYSGYNQEDSVIAHKDAFERGMFNSLYFHTYTNELNKHKTANSTDECFNIPPQRKTRGRKVGTGSSNRYHAIQTNCSYPGLPKVGTYVEKDDILIAKYKSVGDGVYDDVSTVVKEEGIVDLVIPDEHFTGITGATKFENDDGNTFYKARVVNLRKPEIADKFASRSAQKGTVGMIYDSVDMPRTANGLIPDIIMNPHAIPSRMTIAQLIENILGKNAVLSGETRDCTPFTEFDINEAKRELAKYGYDHNGNDVLYNGQTGEMIRVEIFINPTYYQRLKHMVADKIHSRDLGPVQLLTRQPAEGRSRDGGLRIGEMERDCFISNGMSMYLKEKLNESSDIFRTYLSKQKQTIVAVNKDAGIYKYGTEDIYESDDIHAINGPFAMTLFNNELRATMVDVMMDV